MCFHSETEERMSKAEREAEPDRELNAFDIISLSSGFDLSGMFDGRKERARFVSDEPTDGIVERAEEAGRREGLVVRRMMEKVGRECMAMEGRNGNLVAWVELYRLAPGLVMVEVEMVKGEGEVGRWNSEFWRERLAPASPAAAVDGVDSGSEQDF